MYISPVCLAWSFLANVNFGAANFLISFTNDAASSWGVLAVIWLFGGSLGMLSAIYFRVKLGKFLFTIQEEELFLSRTSKGTKRGASLCPPLYQYRPLGTEVPSSCLLKMLVAGLCVGFSQMMMKLAFATDPQNTGPLSAVISSDILIVGVYSHFVYKEKLRKPQVCAIFVVLFGLLFMALCPDSRAASATAESPPGHDEGLTPAGGGGESSSKLMGFVFALLGMSTFAGSLLCIRSSAIDGMAAWSGYSVRMVTQFVMGVVCLGWSDYFTVPFDSHMMLMWPALSGLLQAVGVLALNKALMYPSTGIVNVIAASNSVVVLCMNAVILGLFPTPAKFLGMCVIICGVAFLALWKPKADLDLLPYTSISGYDPLKSQLLSPLRTPLRDG